MEREPTIKNNYDISDTTKEARWVNGFFHGTMMCSNCSYPNRKNGWSGKFILTDFCPRCGFRMTNSGQILV